MANTIELIYCPIGLSLLMELYQYNNSMASQKKCNLIDAHKSGNELPELIKSLIVNIIC